MVEKTACIHQPNYLPWLGYFSKISQSDVFILFDSAQYPKNTVANRNKIRTKDGWAYLTIPIEKKYAFKPFTEVKLPEDDRWKRKHWASITANYSRAKHFNEYKNDFEKLLFAEYPSLAELNLSLIRFIMHALEIKTEIVRSSTLILDLEKRKTEALLEMLEKVGATEYLSGKGASADYLEKEKFTKISLKWHEYTCPEYQQVFSEFESGMAAIDALFNLGKETKKLL